MRTSTILALCIVLVASAMPARAAQAPAETAEQHLALGWKAFDAKDYDLAQKELKRATKLDEKNPEPHVVLAMIARVQNRPHDALSEVKRALELEPDYAEGHYVLGRLYYDRNDIKHAREEAIEAVRLNPNLYAVHSLMADVQIADGQYEEALKSFEMARAISPADFDAIPRLRDRLDALRGFLQDRALRAAGSADFVRPRFLNAPRVEYTEAARKNRVSGTIKLMIRINTQGKVDKVIVLTGLPDGLIESAVRAALRIEAEPATLDGRPVESWSSVLVKLSIR